MFRRNGEQKEQIEDRVRKAGMVMRKIWGIGKRLFRDDVRKRILMFDTLVWAVLGYEIKIWRWKERGRDLYGIGSSFSKI